MASVVPAAATPDYPLDSADQRATVHDGNAVTCEDAGLDGDLVDVEAQISENTYIEITNVSSDVELSGIVVKGGPAYNVYGPDETLGLHAPLNNGGQIAGISHWFACGQQSGSTDETTGSDETGSEAGDTDSAPAAGSETDEASDVESASTDAQDSTTSPAGQVQSANSDTGLANTGVSGSGMLLVLGCALLVVGAGLVFGFRAARRRGDNSTG